MAHMTVSVIVCGRFGAIVVLLHALVLVGVVSHVHGRRVFLVRAVRRGRGPDSLQRQQHQEENSEPTTHRAHCRGFAIAPPRMNFEVSMKIGELAAAAKTAVETIRYYEREGLLPEPARTESNYRSYGDQHLQRLSFIRSCRSLDMTLDEIRALLRFKEDPTGNCLAVNELIDEHVEHVAERIRELKRLQAELKELRSQCDAAGAACGILESLQKREKAPAGPAPKVHVGGAHRRHRGA